MSAIQQREQTFENSPDYVQSLHRGLDVICAFDAQHAAMTLSEVAERTNLSRAVARRLLMTLEYLGYVRRNDRLFTLAPRVLNLGFSYLSSFNVGTLALPAMEELAHSINESCSLAVLDEQDVVYVQRVTVRKVMRIDLDVGARLPAYCASMGRVLVAGLDEAARASWLRKAKLQARTPFTITDKAMLQKVLKGVAASGYAYVEQEMEEGLCSIAVPVRDSAGTPVAALNAGMAFLSGARQRALKEVLPALLEAAEKIERNVAGLARGALLGKKD